MKEDLKLVAPNAVTLDLNIEILDRRVEMLVAAAGSTTSCCTTSCTCCTCCCCCTDIDIPA